MASLKPETQFIARVHKHLPTVYKEKMSNPWRSGTADVWYSGAKGDMWVEYKYLPKLPVRATYLALNLSPRQLKWLADRFSEGREVAVILGTPKGAVFFGGSHWRHNSATFFAMTWISAQLCDVSAVAARIFAITGASPCLLPKV